MKRSAEGSELADAKRPRYEDPPAIDANSDPFRDSLQRKASRISVDGLDNSGFIQARVHMKWPPVGGRANATLEVTEDGRHRHFEVTFLGACYLFFKAIDLKLEIGDTLLLSLESASAETVASSKPNYLPLKLTYEHGVRLKFLTKKTPPTTGMTVDFWEDQARNKRTVVRARAGGDAPLGPLQMDWFSTPQTAAIADPMDIVKEKVRPEKVPERPPSNGNHSIHVPTDNHQQEPPSRVSQPNEAPSPCLNTANATTISPHHQSRILETVANDVSRSNSRELSAPPPKLNPEQMSKKTAKRERRRAGKEARELALLKAQSDVKNCGPRAEDASSLTESTSSAHPLGSSSQTSLAAVEFQTVLPPPSASQKVAQTSETGSELEAGCVGSAGLTYTPLNDLVAGNKFVNVIGIVAATTSLSKTAKDWKITLTLVDPSNVDGSDITHGFKVMCFTDREKLPDVDVGNVIMLRTVKILDWHGGVNGACQSLKPWFWSVYEPKTGKIRHGGPASLSANGSPPKLDQVEQRYCLRLGSWWCDVVHKHNEKLSKAVVVQIGGDIDASLPAPTRRVQRVHRLIKDVSPMAPPDGYFDCTVEILHGHLNNTPNVYSIYVTDYTTNENLPIVDANWCPPSLSNMVLKIETWKHAAEYAETDMKRGDFFSLPNARIKTDSAGYYEGSISESWKFEKLDVDKLEESPRLSDLLSRKLKWEQDSEAAGLNEFPHRLFSEAIPEKHFSCTVQLLAISAKEDRKYIYVTDYTSRPDLAPVYIDSQVTHLIGVDRIVKITLFDEQSKVAEGLELGNYISIKNLRLKPSLPGVDGNIAGRLGGNERLICKLQPQNSGNEELIELLQRKEACEQEYKAKQLAAAKPGAPSRRKQAAAEPKALPQPLKPPPERRLPTSNEKGPLPRPLPIKKVLAHERCPCRFRIVARVVDFWPMDPVNCVGLYCTNCEEDIPANMNDCPACVEDTADSFLQPTFRFYFRLEDEHGDVIRVGINGACTMLSGLEAADLREDEDTYKEFRKRLAPAVGDLIDKHEGKVKDDVPCNTPWLDVIVLSGKSESGERQYMLLDHTVLSGDL